MPLSKSLQIKLQINISINTVTGLVLKNPIALIIPDSGDTIHCIFCEDCNENIPNEESR